MGRQPKLTKAQLLEALKRHKGDYIKVAVEFDVSPSTVYRSVERYGIEVIPGEPRIKAA